MASWLRLGGLVLAAIVGLWIVLQVVSAVFGLISWLVSAVITLLVLAVLAYLAYLAFSAFAGGRGGSRSKERERLLE